jgi:hypothetical protein
MSLHDYFTRFISDHKNSDMLLIQDVKYTNVPKDPWELENLVQTHFLKDMDPYSVEGKQIFNETTYLQKEIIQGVRFKNKFGDEICIGIPEKIQGILGLPFSEFDSLRCRIEELTYERKKIAGELHHVTTELKQFKNMTFWQKVKFLFKIENKYIKLKDLKKTS